MNLAFLCCWSIFFAYQRVKSLFPVAVSDRASSITLYNSRVKLNMYRSCYGINIVQKEGGCLASPAPTSCVVTTESIDHISLGYDIKNSVLSNKFPEILITQSLQYLVVGGTNRLPYS